MAEGEEKGNDYGRFCVFCSRFCGSISAIIYLLCGFAALIPAPSIAPGTSYSRCLAVGLLMIIAAVVVFFLEVTFLGHLTPHLAFLLAINKYMKNWMRTTLYILFAFIPIFLWCIAFSTIIGMGIMFTTGLINFMLVIGAKGDHSENVNNNTSTYRRVTFSEVSKAEKGGESSS